MVSDLHLGHILHSGFARKIIKLINEQKPDIVFIPGDFYDGVHTDFGALAAEFKTVSAPLGMYFCSGNHEMFAGYGACETAIKNAGIKILEDEKLEIDGIQIAGLAYKEETDETVVKRLEAIGLNREKPSILLKHVPNRLGPISRAGASLVLSGHSHQGQIWPFRYITYNVFKGFDYGLKSKGATQVYTSSGAGTWGPPMRVFTKSEIVKIIFE
jgi:predicted MPP superfamily phosphohydrolase